MPNYSYFCDVCESTNIEHFRIADRPDTVTCACGEVAHFTITPTAVMRHAFHDGVKRSGFADMKEASKLNREAAVSNNQTKKEIHKEIQKMGVSIKKEGV